MPSARGARVATLVFSLSALLCVGAGAVAAARSPLFLVQVVEIADLPENAPVDAQEITRLANVPVGKVSLFQLDLESIERRILSDPWIRQVRIQKRFPQTLSISVSFREPRALLQTAQGGLSYVDTEGTAFGRVTTRQAGLPVIEGAVDPSRIREALKIVSLWDERMNGVQAELSSLGWDPERGYRAVAIYPLGTKAVLGPDVALRGRGRAFIDLGQNFDSSFEPQLARLASVLSYLRDKSIPVRQIWVDSGKKIVVRTVRGS